MTKAEFLETLSNLLESISPEERTNTLEYYTEMIEDRMENGLSEEEAVAALGDIREIADQVKQCASECNQARPVAEPASALRSITIEESSGDLLIEGGNFDAPYTLDFENGRKEEYAVSEQNGALVIRHIRQKRSGAHFSLFSAASSKLILHINGALDQLNVCTSSGDTEIRTLTVKRTLTVSGTSGDVRLSEVHCPGECSLNTGSGDIRAEGCSWQNAKITTASGNLTLFNGSAETMEIHSASGDIDIQDSNIAQALRLQTSSGDVSFRHVKVPDFCAKSLSGDFDLTDSDFGTLQGQSASGDFCLRSVQANHIQLSAASGDLRIQLREIEGGYDFRTRSTVGAVRAPILRGEHIVELTTASGDITASVK